MLQRPAPASAEAEGVITVLMVWDYSIHLIKGKKIKASHPVPLSHK